MLSDFLSFVDKVFFRFYRFFLRVFNQQIIFIHTPKCGGGYVNSQYDIKNKSRIRNVGHANFRKMKLMPNTPIVGLIREPWDWYSSYYYFCKKSLLKRPQGINNFPIQHPIAVFSKNATSGLEQMIFNMANQEFLNQILTRGITANVYAREIDDVFGFMKRTDSGFWTWTMMYHFSKKRTKEINSKKKLFEKPN